MNYLVIHISTSAQIDHVRLISLWPIFTKKQLSVIHLSFTDINDNYTHFQQTFIGSKSIFNILKNFSRNYFVEWNFFNIIPFSFVKILKNVNFLLNIVCIKFLFAKRKKIVFLYNYPDKSVFQFVKKVKPYLTIGDCTEYWKKKDFISSLNYTDIYTTNSSFYNEHLKSHVEVKKIPSGYFSKKTISILQKKNIRKAKTKCVFYLGSIDYRIDFYLLRYLMKNLTDYKFVFCSNLLFDYNFKYQSEYLHKRNIVAKKSWDQITKEKNFFFIENKNHADLEKLELLASVAILPYDYQDKFYFSINPVKIQAYFSLGFPVVSTPLYNLTKENNEYLFLTSKYDDFLKKIQVYDNMDIIGNEFRLIKSKMKNEAADNKAKKILKIIKSQNWSKYNQ